MCQCGLFAHGKECGLYKKWSLHRILTAQEPGTKLSKVKSGGKIVDKCGLE